MKNDTLFLIAVLHVGAFAAPALAADDSSPVPASAASDTSAAAVESPKRPADSFSRSVARIRTKDDIKGAKAMWGAVVRSDAVPGEGTFIVIAYRGRRFDSVDAEVKHLRQHFDGAAVTAGDWTGFVTFVDHRRLLGLVLLRVDSDEAKLPAFELRETWPTQNQRVLIHHGRETKAGRLTVKYKTATYPWNVTLDDGSQPQPGAPVTSHDGRLMGLVDILHFMTPADRQRDDGAISSVTVLIPAERIDAILRIQHPAMTEELADVLVGTAFGITKAQFRSRADESEPQAEGAAPSSAQPSEGAAPPYYKQRSPSTLRQPMSVTPAAQPSQLKPSTVESRKDEVKVFQLQNASFEEIIPTLEVLFPASMKMSALPSQRTIIARGPADELQIVEAILLRLDGSRPAPGPGWEPPSQKSDASPAAPAPVDGRDHEDGEDIPFQDIDAAPEKARQIERNLGTDPGTADLMRDDAVQAIIEQRLSLLVESYNKLMDEGRFAEALGMVKLVEELAGKNPIARQMRIDGQRAYRSDRNEATKERDVNQILEQLKKLKAAERRGHDRDSAREIDGYVPDVFGGGPGWEKLIREGRHLSPKGLRVEFAEREAKARQVAQRLRSAIESGDDAVETGDLRGAVSEAFDSRQTLQQRELAELAERLAAIQQSLEAREQKKDEIINRRVQELLNPELEWDNSSDTPSSRPHSSRTDPHEASSDHSRLRREETVADQRASATGDDLPKDPKIRMFDPSRSGSGTSVTLGVVNAVPNHGTYVISTKDPRLINQGDILEISRPMPGSADQRQRFGEVEVIAHNGAFASVRLFSSTRERFDDNRYIWKTPQPGDIVSRPRGEQSASVHPAYQEAWRAQSAKNLKQIMIAFHNYHDVYGHFPPAMLKGKGNNGRSQHPHSWRVAILPFIEQAELYQQYDLDEPWNSPHNASLLARMPDVFRSPRDTPDSTNTSYFGVVSPEGERPRVGEDRTATLFTNPQGTPIRDISDGTSNTIAIVEAKRAVPWTKPEDIPFDIDGTFPALGGWFAEGFHAGLADGSAKFLSKENDEQTLRNLLRIQDSNIIEPQLVK